MTRSAIQISSKGLDKLKALKNHHKLKSYEDVLNKYLPKGISNELDHVTEHPAIVLVGESVTPPKIDEVVEVSLDTLKNSHTNTEWIAKGTNNVVKATVMFKDSEGVFVRFIDMNVNKDSEYYSEKSIHQEYYQFI